MNLLLLLSIQNVGLYFYYFTAHLADANILFLCEIFHRGGYKHKLGTNKTKKILEKLKGLIIIGKMSFNYHENVIWK